MAQNLITGEMREMLKRALAHGSVYIDPDRTVNMIIDIFDNAGILNKKGGAKSETTRRRTANRSGGKRRRKVGTGRSTRAREGASDD